MKITLDVSDFWLDEEDIESGLKNYVTRQVLAQVTESIKEKIEKQITLLIIEKLEKQLDKKILKVISEGTIKSKKSSNIVPMEEYVKEIFLDNSNWRSMESFITKASENITIDMKKRYDLLFASQLVSKMTNAGLINKDVAQLLFSNP